MNTEGDSQHSGVESSKAMTVFRYRSSLHRLHGRLSDRYRKLMGRLESLPLAFKLSFLITALVVSCMLLLGTLLIRQQMQQFTDQIGDQGSTLVRLMAKAAREPLLADDEIALDTITDSFSRGSSVIGTAIATLEGDIVSRAGSLLEEKNPLTQKIVGSVIIDPSRIHSWKWQPLTNGRQQTVTAFTQPVKFQDVTAGYALVAFSQAAMTASMHDTIKAMLAVTFLIILLGIGMAFVIGRRITQPVDRLVQASHIIGNGDYSFRFHEQRKDEIGQLMEAFNDMAQGMLEKSQVKNALSRFVSPCVAREILSNLDDVALGGKRVEGSVVFADIKGFTTISEQIRPEDLVSILNRYFTLITRACEINHGFVDKYLGDGVMLVFGAPDPDADHAFHAVSCALLIQRLIAKENSKRKETGLFPVEFRIGANTGSMLAGNMGSEDRMEYTVVGDTVNLASRLCGITNANEIVISREMYLRDNLQHRILAGEYQSIRLRGISLPVNTYRVEQLAADYQSVQDEQYEAVYQPAATEKTNA